MQYKSVAILRSQCRRGLGGQRGKAEIGKAEGVLWDYKATGPPEYWTKERGAVSVGRDWRELTFALTGAQGPPLGWRVWKPAIGHGGAQPAPVDSQWQMADSRSGRA